MHFHHQYVLVGNTVIAFVRRLILSSLLSSALHCCPFPSPLLFPAPSLSKSFYSPARCDDPTLFPIDRKKGRLNIVAAWQPGTKTGGCKKKKKKRRKKKNPVFSLEPLLPSISDPRFSTLSLSLWFSSLSWLMVVGSGTLAEWNSLQTPFISILSGACRESAHQGIEVHSLRERGEHIEQDSTYEEWRPTETAFNTPQRNKKERAGRERGRLARQLLREKQGERERRQGEKTAKEENRRTRQRAGQAVGQTQQEGLFNKHELEPSAIECYNGKLMQMRGDLMTKWSGWRKEKKREEGEIKEEMEGRGEGVVFKCLWWSVNRGVSLLCGERLC